MAGRVGQDALEVLLVETGQVRVTQDVVEVLCSTYTRDPTTVTGAAVTQDVVEVMLVDVARAKVTQDVVEVLLRDGDWSPGGTGAAGVRVFGWAG